MKNEEREYEERLRAAFKVINPPMDDAKKYLNQEEWRIFGEAVGQAIDVYLEKGASYQYDINTLYYRGWLSVIQKRKDAEAQKEKATHAAYEYSHRLNQQIAELTSRLDSRQRDLAIYFQRQIQDKRYRGHYVNYAMHEEDKSDLDDILINVAKKRLMKFVSNELLYFIKPLSQYYRIYFQLPIADYIFDEVPCVDLSFENFAAAYAEVWLKPGKKSFYGYQFVLPYREEKDYTVLSAKPRLLGYYYIILTPEDLGCRFWQRIPLVLFKGLINGDIKSDTITISAASGSVTTYKVRGFAEEVTVPDELVEYLKNIGSIDRMVSIGIMTEKVGNIVTSAFNEIETKQEIMIDRDNARVRNSNKKKAFRLFGQGIRPSDHKLKALGIKPNSAYRYYQEWKKTGNQCKA